MVASKKKEIDLEEKFDAVYELLDRYNKATVMLFRGIREEEFRHITQLVEEEIQRIESLRLDLKFFVDEWGIHLVPY